VPIAQAGTAITRLFYATHAASRHYPAYTSSCNKCADVIRNNFISKEADPYDMDERELKQPEINVDLKIKFLPNRKYNVSPLQSSQLFHSLTSGFFPTRASYTLLFSPAISPW
jgi:hypothetical protein